MPLSIHAVVPNTRRLRGSRGSDGAHVPTRIVFVEIFDASRQVDQTACNKLILDRPFSRHARVPIPYEGAAVPNIRLGVFEHQISAEVTIRLVMRPGHGPPRGRESADADAL